ncbi:unnamed protein product [Diatraea saccharalis]|uniref:Uncharacterized protein n=1 Tax=Diatraea saccharalis TaxID=40085 RepID=A0A9N9WGI6_9NEOP|nr:unnamed protein product [Diatraea saccharalis]
MPQKMVPKLSRKLRRWNEVFNATNVSTLNEKKNETKEWLFKHYLKKFRPINVWERLYKKKKALGLNVTFEDCADEIFDDENYGSGRRKWSPPGRLDKELHQETDLFSMRRRFYDLILHSMYWTRNKMINMQVIRKKYKDSKLYKMGFMMSKNDIACKMFHKFAFIELITCSKTYYGSMARYYPIEMLHTEERMLNKWFDITLLTDLIVKNDETCKEMLEEANTNRENAWEFYD